MTFDTMYLTAGGLTSLINGLSIDVLKHRTCEESPDTAGVAVLSWEPLGQT